LLKPDTQHRALEGKYDGNQKAALSLVNSSRIEAHAREMEEFKERAKAGPGGVPWT
jgi:hypothetical protein